MFATALLSRHLEVSTPSFLVYSRPRGAPRPLGAFRLAMQQPSLAGALLICGGERPCHTGFIHQSRSSRPSCVVHRCELQSACVAHRFESQSACMAHKCESQYQ